MHHLADSHANAYVRFKLALTEEWPTIKPYDEAAWADLADSRLPIERSLAMIAACTRAGSRCSNLFPKRTFSAASTIPNAVARIWPPTSPSTPGTPATTPRTFRSARAQGLVGFGVSARCRRRSATKLAQIIEEYLADHPAAALLEDGRVLFDMRTRSLRRHRVPRPLPAPTVERRAQPDAHRGRSKERAQSLRLLTRRMGAARPQALELVPTSDRRTPTTRDSARRNYQRLLERALTRAFIGSKVDGLRSAMDLEHSFGPAYVRGRLLEGTAADAVIGVSEAESAATIDGILTLGILWLDYCRKQGDARRHFGGLKVIVPAGAWRTTAERMAWLNHAAADFQLFTLDERSEELAPVDFRDTGNL